MLRNFSLIVDYNVVTSFLYSSLSLSQGLKSYLLVTLAITRSIMNGKENFLQYVFQIVMSFSFLETLNNILLDSLSEFYFLLFLVKQNCWCVNSTGYLIVSYCGFCMKSLGNKYAQNSIVSSVAYAEISRRISWVWIRVFPARTRPQREPKPDQEGPR